MSEEVNKASRMVLVIVLVIAVIIAGILVINHGKKNQESVNGTEDIQVVKGSAQGFKGEVNATVSVKDGKIVDLTVVGLDETPEIGGEAIKTLSQQIIENKSTNGIDSVSGATYTSNAVFSAIADALTKLQ